MSTHRVYETHDAEGCVADRAVSLLHICIDASDTHAFLSKEVQAVLNMLSM